LLLGRENDKSVTASQTTDPQKKQPKEDKDLRLRKQHFPNAEELVLNTGKAGFVPMPIIMRKLMRHISPPELRVLVYLQTRCSKYFICYPTLEEMAHDLGLAGRKNLTPHLKALEKKKFITQASSGGKTFFLVHDPRVAVEHLVETGAISKDELYDINELRHDLNQTEITAERKPAEPLKLLPLRKAK
jgi:hypothetical protein